MTRKMVDVMWMMGMQIVRVAETLPSRVIQSDDDSGLPGPVFPWQPPSSSTSKYLVFCLTQPLPMTTSVPAPTLSDSGAIPSIPQQQPPGLTISQWQLQWWPSQFQFYSTMVTTTPQPQMMTTAIPSPYVLTLASSSNNNKGWPLGRAVLQ